MTGNDITSEDRFPPAVAAIRDRGYAQWAGDELSPSFRAQFDERRIPVKGVRQVRVWGLQVDDERELPGHERTSIPDEEIWEDSEDEQQAGDEDAIACVSAHVPTMGQSARRFTLGFTTHT